MLDDFLWNDESEHTPPDQGMGIFFNLVPETNEYGSTHALYGRYEIGSLPGTIYGRATFALSIIAINNDNGDFCYGTPSISELPIIPDYPPEEIFCGSTGGLFNVDFRIVAGIPYGEEAEYTVFIILDDIVSETKTVKTSAYKTNHGRSAKRNPVNFTEPTENSSAEYSSDLDNNYQLVESDKQVVISGNLNINKNYIIFVRGLMDRSTTVFYHNAPEEEQTPARRDFTITRHNPNDKHVTHKGMEKIFIYTICEGEFGEVKSVEFELDMPWLKKEQ